MWEHHLDKVFNDHTVFGIDIDKRANVRPVSEPELLGVLNHPIILGRLAIFGNRVLQSLEPVRRFRGFLKFQRE